MGRSRKNQSAMFSVSNLLLSKRLNQHLLATSGAEKRGKLDSLGMGFQRIGSGGTVADSALNAAILPVLAEYYRFGDSPVNGFVELASTVRKKGTHPGDCDLKRARRADFAP